MKVMRKVHTRVKRHLKIRSHLGGARELKQRKMKKQPAPQNQ